MKEYNIEVLKDAAKRLLFDMSESEYETLLKEFDIVTKQMSILGRNSEIEKYEPMSFPFECSTSYLREDEPEEPLSREEALRNSKRKIGGQIKLPKVVQ
jgi:aspartyl/glutamyl-tRNA(Asn/Gln) amidotransferase C subunit